MERREVYGEKKILCLLSGRFLRRYEKLVDLRDLERNIRGLWYGCMG